jgi:hypothetical protein
MYLFSASEDLSPDFTSKSWHKLIVVHTLKEHG